MYEGIPEKSKTKKKSAFGTLLKSNKSKPLKLKPWFTKGTYLAKMARYYVEYMKELGAC